MLIQDYNISKGFAGGIYWLLDVRFDFLLPWFEKYYQIKEEDITFVQSFHGIKRKGKRVIQLGDCDDSIVNLWEPDELNKRFSQTIDKFKEPAFIVSFTGAGLPSNDKVITLSSAGKKADICNDKWWQYQFFEKHGIRTPKTWNYNNLYDLGKSLQGLLEEYKTLVLKTRNLSGGYKMKILSTGQELMEYQAEQTDDFLSQSFLVSEYIPWSQSFAGMGNIAASGKVIYIGCTEQVLYQKVAYEGLIFPAFADKETLYTIQKETLRIGRNLEEYGYCGFYNVDYILCNKVLYAVEINARFGFGTILASCVYKENFWKMLSGEMAPQLETYDKRIILGKIKGKMGTKYSHLISLGSMEDWIEKRADEFYEFYCGTDKAVTFQNGSFIGLFGMYLQTEDSRHEVMRRFWNLCLRYYR